jgi:hypothetical protein
MFAVSSSASSGAVETGAGGVLTALDQLAIFFAEDQELNVD